VIAIAGLIEPPLVLLADHVTAKLRASRQLALWLDRALGGTLIALGVGLAATRR
jgi:threonine/homoserine/homoserine lactone efflux protein